MPLTDTQLMTLKPRDKAYKVADGGGLHIFVTAKGSRLWRYKFRFEGKEKLMALGKYPDVSLAQVRDKHKAARNLLA